MTWLAKLIKELELAKMCLLVCILLVFGVCFLAIKMCLSVSEGYDNLVFAT